MTKTVQDQEWQWVRPYRAIARWVGWVLVALAVINFISIIFFLRLPAEYPQVYSVSLNHLWHVLRKALLPGLLSLGVAQFLYWMSTPNSNPGWLIRKGPILLAIGAAVYFLHFSYVIYRVPSIVTMYSKQMPFFLGMTTVIISDLLPLIAPAIILVGLAQALRRLSPIIDESKSLV